MKYYTQRYDNVALYYDTDADRAFVLTPSYARKHKIKGVSFKNHKMVCDNNNKYRYRAILKNELAGIRLSELVVEYNGITISMSVSIIVKDIWKISFGNYPSLPLPLEYMSKFTDIDSFNMNKHILVNTYRATIVKLFGSVDNFLNAEFKKCDNYMIDYFSNLNLSGVSDLVSRYSENDVLGTYFLFNKIRGIKEPDPKNNLVDYWYELYVADGYKYDTTSINTCLLGRLPKYICLRSNFDLRL